MSFIYGNYGGVSTYGYPYGNVRPQNVEREYPDSVFRMPEKKDNNTTAKVVGTAAAIAAAIYLIKTGKAGKAIEFVKNKNPLKNLNVTAIKDRANTAFQKVKDKVIPAKINEQAGKLKDKAGEFIKNLKKDINTEKVTFKQIQAAYDAAGKKMPRLSDKLKWAEKLALWQDMLRTNSPKLKDIV